MGEYDGVFISFSSYRLRFKEVGGDELEFPVLTNDVADRIKALALEPNDVIRVQVEFTDYSVMHVSVPELEPRALLERIQVLERLVEELQWASSN